MMHRFSRTVVSATRRVGAASAVIGAGFTTAATSPATSPFAHVPMGPPDKILGLNEAFLRDTSPLKVNLGVGAYRDDNSKPMVLPSVIEAERRLLDKLEKGQINKEYAGIAGIPAFNTLAAKFVLGNDSPLLKDGRVAITQTLSGTGGCRLVAEFTNRFLEQTPASSSSSAAGKKKVMYVPSPTWPNHNNIIRDAGLAVSSYRYYNKDTRQVDFEGMCADLENADEGTVILLHACAHNPTGVDMSLAQWRQLGDLFKRKKLIAFFDTAYQGFASGDADRDAAPLRMFAHELNLPLLVANSFAKNFGLYGERAGAVMVVGSSKEEADKITSQLKILIRPMYSSPPTHGAQIIVEIMSDEQLFEQWRQECKGMATRIHDMRSMLRGELERLAKEDGSASKLGLQWNHVTDQIGMFCYSGLNPAQVSSMINKHHIYLTEDGRISMAGVTTKNVKYLAQSMHDVVTTVQ